MERKFEDYRHDFEPRFYLERTESGILTVRWQQPDASEMSRGAAALLEFPPILQLASSVWNTIGEDVDNSIIILTGTDGNFYGGKVPTPAAGATAAAQPAAPVGTNKFNAELWTKIMRGVTRSIDSFLNLPTVLIGAANGPATIHAEYLMSCDTVIASENATFADHAHFTRDLLPGDGSNIIWPLLLGHRRSADFLLTGRVITAHEAMELGLVREVVSEKDLLPRCHDLAEQLAKTSASTRRLTAVALRQRLRRMMQEELHHTMALEGITYLDRSANPE